MVCVPQPDMEKRSIVANNGDNNEQQMQEVEEEENKIVACSAFDMTSRSHDASKSRIFVHSNNTISQLYEQMAHLYGHSSASFEITFQCLSTGIKDFVVLSRETPSKKLREIGLDTDEDARNSFIIQDIKRDKKSPSTAQSSGTSTTKGNGDDSPCEVDQDDDAYLHNVRTVAKGQMSLFDGANQRDEDPPAQEEPAADPEQESSEVIVQTEGPPPPPPQPPLPLPVYNTATSKTTPALEFPSFSAASSIINKSETSYVGLVNQAMTCYLNSLLQALYMTPEFRNALYKWEFDGKEGDTGAKSIPFQLQKLFLNLQTSKKASVETTELTRSFGWDSSEAWQQHDVQELCRVMFDALEHKFKNTDQADLINNLYEGKMIDYVKCLECGTEKQREDKFLDIPLPVRPFGSSVAYGSVEEALRAFAQPETLDGVNQYHCEKCSKKCDAHKGLKFTKFPYLLTLHLKRFDFDYNTLHRIKLNDKVTFPELLDLNCIIAKDNSETANHSEEAIKCDDGSTTDSGSALEEDALMEAAAPLQQQIENTAHDDEGVDVNYSINGPSATLENNEKNARRSCEKGPFNYELFAIMIHSGSASGGHYYAYIKDFSSGQWFCFNDQSVTRITNDDICKTYGGGSSRTYYSGTYSSSTNAYMLMYRQIDKQRNCEVFKQDNFPEHIKFLLNKMQESDEKERFEREKQCETRRIKVQATHPTTNMRLDCKVYMFSDLPVSEVTERAYKLLMLEGLVSLENCRLVAYDHIHDSVECSFDGKENEPISEVINGLRKQNLDFMLEIKKNDDPWQPIKPGSIVAKVLVVDIIKEEINGPFSVKANQSMTIPEFRVAICDAIPQHLSSIPHEELIVALERYGGQVRLLEDNTKTIKSENFYGSDKIYVATHMDNDKETTFMSSKMYKVVERFENTITITMSLPDVDPKVLEEMNIPTLAQVNSEPVAPPSEEANYYYPSASWDGAIEPPPRPVSSLQVLPPPLETSYPEDETTGGTGGDQSASEDSSLTDSERTLVGDQENLLAQLSSEESPQGPDPPAATSPDEDEPPMTRTLKTLKELDHYFPQYGDQASYFRATPYEEDDTKMLKIHMDKRIPLPTLKKYLEPYVGVPESHFKIFRSYLNPDQLEYMGYHVVYKDGDTLSIKLGRALRKNECKGKVFQLIPDAAEPVKFLFDWVLAKRTLVAEAKKQILDELKKKHDIDIPFERCRLRKKCWKNPGTVYYDEQRFEDTMCLVSSWELFIQELPQVPTATHPPYPELVLFVRRWRPSTLTLDPLQEVEVDSVEGEELRNKLAGISDIAAENMEIAKGQGSFPCDMSVLAVNTDLDWNSPTNSLNTWPLNLFEDGHVIYYRDSTEKLKDLTADEKKEIEKVESSRLTRIAPGTAISTYSPRKERALKIYLDNTPPKSHIPCDDE